MGGWGCHLCQPQKDLLVVTHGLPPLISQKMKSSAVIHCRQPGGREAGREAGKWRKEMRQMKGGR